MPRSISTTSARTPSASRRSRPVAKSPRTKRVRQPASAASSAKRSSATGSRSMPTSSPSGPRRSAISRAWPAPPTVQSIATSPGRGSSSSSTSSARTGSWRAVMSSRVTKLRGDVVDGGRQLRVEVGPALAIPDLHRLAGADDDDVLAQAGVVDERRRDHDAAGGVQLGRERVRGEEQLDAPGLRRERVHALQRRGHARVVLGGAPEIDAGIQALRENHAIGERGPELGRDGESVLRIQRVVEGAAEGYCVVMSVRRRKSRDGGVGGAPPPRLAVCLLPHFPPQSNPNCTQFPTRSHIAAPKAPDWLT